MRHLDLFSGIGGFALAAQWVWGDEHEIVSFVEIDPFCQKVLNKHWPDVPIISDIRDVTYERLVSLSASNGLHSQELRELQEDNGASPTGQNDDAETCGCSTPGTVDKGERNERILADTAKQGLSERERQTGKVRKAGIRPQQKDRTNRKRNFKSIDLLTGGFPCQPFSVAGKRQAERDDRFLWPEMLRVIREIRPTWVIGENVAGIINLALDQVCADLESASYEVQPFLIPACGVDAPHRRDRVWIVAKSEWARAGDRLQKIGRQKRESTQKGASGLRQGNGQIGAKGIDSRGQDVADPDNERLQGVEKAGNIAKSGEKSNQFIRRCDKRRGASGVAQSRLGGMADGPACWLDEPNIPRVATGVKNRVDRLKSLGNAIVPQVAMQFLRAIKEIEKIKT
jgi:DNA (cytosine-5)-methyltransferase 1